MSGLKNSSYKVSEIFKPKPSKTKKSKRSNITREKRPQEKSIF